MQEFHALPLTLKLSNVDKICVTANAVLLIVYWLMWLVCWGVWRVADKRGGGFAVVGAEHTGHHSWRPVLRDRRQRPGAEAVAVQRGRNEPHRPGPRRRHHRCPLQPRPSRHRQHQCRRCRLHLAVSIRRPITAQLGSLLPDSTPSLIPIRVKSWLSKRATVSPLI